MTQDLLIEIGTEELPPKQLKTLSQALADLVKKGLEKIGVESGAMQVFASPRRLAVLIKDTQAQQKSQLVEKRGPALKACFDAQGNPTLACLGFVSSCGGTVDQLTTEETDKGSWVFFRQELPGKALKVLLPAVLQQAIEHLPIAKPMRWGNHSWEFVRPVHWILLLFGNEIIETEILGQKSGRETRGHRFMHPQAIAIARADEYEDRLQDVGFVIADFEKRKQLITQQINEIAASKGHILADAALLDEVTALVEWPVALLAQFDAQFLGVPPEAIITAMKNHQKCFAVLNSQNQLQPYFIAISNIISKDPQRVVGGNERVMRARLADAQFFYHSDLEHSQESRLLKLQKVIYQQKLGTLFDKSQRISQLAVHLAKQLGQDEGIAERAGLLCKTDLVSSMVEEFPELQGYMGYYYALRDQEPQNVAIAIREHYQPRFAGDNLPETVLGCVVAIADRIDSLIGLFGTNQPPSGEKDPYGLRRAALGILRIMIEKQLSLDLYGILTEAFASYAQPLENADAVQQAFDFIMERLRAWYSDREIETEVFNAVLAKMPTRPLDFHHRILAIQHFQALPEAKGLAAANKRVSNILKTQGDEWRSHPVNPALLRESAEKKLLSALEKKNKEVEILFNQAKYTEAMTALASLRTPIDAFFDQVMVMVDDESIRNNRLALLGRLQHLFLHVADISVLAN